MARKLLVACGTIVIVYLWHEPYWLARTLSASQPASQPASRAQPMAEPGRQAIYVSRPGEWVGHHIGGDLRATPYPLQIVGDRGGPRIFKNTLRLFPMTLRTAQNVIMWSHLVQTKKSWLTPELPQVAPEHPIYHQQVWTNYEIHQHFGHLPSGSSMEYLETILRCREILNE